MAEATFNPQPHSHRMPAMGWVGSAGKARKYETMALVQTFPPLTPAVAPIYVPKWAQRL